MGAPTATAAPASVSTSAAAAEQQPKDANAALTLAVERLLVKKAGDIKSDPVLQLASQQQTYAGLVGAGSPIYVGRNRYLVYLWITSATSAFLYAAVTSGVIPTLLAAVLALLAYDLLSGFLHIVLDNPANLPLPILGQPCLEFQMHHYFPTDIQQRDYLDVIGDLNTVVCLMGAVNFMMVDVFVGTYWQLLVPLKVAMAYYGQYSHRCAHSSTHAQKSGGVVARTLQQCGLMVSVDSHRSHHREPHDTDFCLIGICNPVINALYTQCRNRWVWMTGFFALSAFSVLLEDALLQTVYPM